MKFIPVDDSVEKPKGMSFQQANTHWAKVANKLSRKLAMDLAEGLTRAVNKKPIVPQKAS